VCSFLLIFGRGVSFHPLLPGWLFLLRLGFHPWSVEEDSTTPGRPSEEEGVSSPSSEADFEDVLSSTASVYGTSGSFRTFDISL
jgi:hypothetical protein